MAEPVVVEVVYADETRQLVRRVELSSGSSVAQAIDVFVIAESLPADIKIDNVGIFGRKVTMNRILLDGDRVEIYRPLALNPMEARRRRAR